MQDIFIQIREVEPVLHTNRQILFINQCALYILIDLLYFQQMRMRFPDSIYQPIATEVSKAGHIFRPVISSVCPIPFTILVYFTERLIYPVPDTTSLCHRLIFEDLPVFFHSAAAIAHCMQILAKNERTINILACHIISDHIHTAIHPAIDIGIIVFFRTFVLYRTVFLHRFQPVIRTFEIDSVAGFITERPDDNRGMILRTFIHTACTVYMGRKPRTVLCKRGRTITHTVRFNISLINHIKSVTVAKLIPVGMCRIMRVAYRIDVMLFH